MIPQAVSDSWQRRRLKPDRVENMVIGRKYGYRGRKYGYRGRKYGDYFASQQKLAAFDLFNFLEKCLSFTAKTAINTLLSSSPLPNTTRPSAIEPTLS